MRRGPLCCRCASLAELNSAAAARQQGDLMKAETVVSVAYICMWLRATRESSASHGRVQLYRWARKDLDCGVDRLMEVRGLADRSEVPGQ